MKPYLINIYSPRDEDIPFFKSLEPFKRGFDHLVVTLPVYPGNIERFFFIPEVIEDNTWYIFCDTSDVRMQTPLPNLDDVKGEIIVANENELHKNSWWADKLEGFDYLKNKTIYNAGLFAMKGKMLKKFIKQLNLHFNSSVAPYTDQLVFNMFCQQYKTLVVEHPSLFVTLYSNVEKLFTMKTKEGWINTNSELFTFVHGNGYTKELL